MSRNFHPSKGLIESAKKVRAAQAYTESVRPVIVDLQQHVLLSDTFREFRSGERITDPRHIYRMGDDDFQIFLRLLHDRYAKAGYKVEFGYCPLLIAENRERQAIDLLIRASQELNADFDVEIVLRSVEGRREYLDLLLQLLSRWMDH